MSEMTRTAVEAAWETTGLDQGYPSPEALAAAIEIEAQRLETLIWDAEDQFKSAGIARFREQNQGHLPPFQETLQIATHARAQAEELILRQELGEAVEAAVLQNWATVEADEEDPGWRENPDRWKTHKAAMGDPSPEIDELTDRVWPEQSIRFRVMAAYLMQVRFEDGQRYPMSPGDPLKASFTDLVDTELADIARVRTEYDRLNPTS